jgi:deoxyribodipyrimidine photo-lyase
MYSPAKQLRDHDPHGQFVRRWVPEWGSDAYPAPIVEERAALTAAKERLFGLRRSERCARRGRCHPAAARLAPERLCRAAARVEPGPRRSARAGRGAQPAAGALLMRELI